MRKNINCFHNKYLFITLMALFFLQFIRLESIASDIKWDAFDEVFPTGPGYIPRTGDSNEKIIKCVAFSRAVHHSLQELGDICAENCHTSIGKQGVCKNRTIGFERGGRGTFFKWRFVYTFKGTRSAFLDYLDQLKSFDDSRGTEGIICYLDNIQKRYDQGER